MRFDSEQFVYDHARGDGRLVQWLGRRLFSREFNDALNEQHNKDAWWFIRNQPDLATWLPGEPIYQVEVKAPKEPDKYPDSVTVNRGAAMQYVHWNDRLCGRLRIVCVFGEADKRLGYLTVPRLLQCRPWKDVYIVTASETAPWPNAFREEA